MSEPDGLAIPENIQDTAENPALELPPGTEQPASGWKLVAQNKRVIRAWAALCRSTTEDALRCYKWLQANAMQRYPKRCYPLKGEEYRGCWCYEIGSGNRVYYKPDGTNKCAVIYYAGEHPPKAPAPPR